MINADDQNPPNGGGNHKFMVIADRQNIGGNHVFKVTADHRDTLYIYKYITRP